MTMTRQSYRECGSLESRLDTIGMSNSDRSASIGALHRSVIIVEGFAWIIRKLRQIRVFMFVKPALAK